MEKPERMRKAIEKENSTAELKGKKLIGKQVQIELKIAASTLYRV